MANTFEPKGVPGALKAEVEARADGLRLTKWSAKRFPWIHVLSCSDTDNGYGVLGNAPSGNTLTFGGSTPSQSGYNKSTNLPFPIVEGLEIKAMGSLGTTRKGTLSIKCFTDDDLIGLQKNFFIPGMDVRVQWGWNESCNGFSPPPILTSKSLETAAATRAINKLRKNNTNYDGFQGIVSNFGYNLNSDNTWACEIEFISAADPFTDSSINNSDHPCAREVENDETESVESFGPIYAALRDIYKTFIEAGRIATQVRARAPKRSPKTKYYVALKEYEGFARTEQGGDDSGWLSGVFGGVETEEAFINFGFLLDLINTTQIPSIGNKYPYGNISCSNVKLPKPKVALSTDPRVCYLPGQRNNKFLDHRIGFVDGSIPCVESDHVRLDNIMLNVVFLLVQYKTALNGDGKLSTFVNSVLNEINRVCGSPWTFVMVSDESDDSSTGPTINIIDSKQAVAATTPFLIPGTVSDSTLRDFGLNLKMTGAMKTQALYANNPQKGRGYGDSGGDATGCTGVSVKPFFLGGSIKNLAKPSTTATTADLNCGDAPEAKADPSFDDLIDNLYYDVNDQTCGALLEGLVKEINNDDSKKHCLGVPLPFDLNFTMDGIGGFEFGQLVSSNRIPTPIREEFRWQVTKVEHSITANDWSTTVSTVCRAQPK
jgi:hypothetical protein